MKVSLLRSRSFSTKPGTCTVAKPDRTMIELDAEVYIAGNAGPEI